MVRAPSFFSLGFNNPSCCRSAFSPISWSAFLLDVAVTLLPVATGYVHARLRIEVTLFGQGF